MRHLPPKCATTRAIRIAILATALVCVSRLGYPKDIDAISKACDRGESKACSELRKIATREKDLEQRVAAVRLVSDTALLTELATDEAQPTTVRLAAQARLDAKRQLAEQQAAAATAQAAAAARAQDLAKRRLEQVQTDLPRLTDLLTTLSNLLNSSFLNLATEDGLHEMKLVVDNGQDWGHTLISDYIVGNKRQFCYLVCYDKPLTLSCQGQDNGA